MDEKDTMQSTKREEILNSIDDACLILIKSITESFNVQCHPVSSVSLAEKSKILLDVAAICYKVDMLRNPPLDPMGEYLAPKKLT